MVGVAGKSKGCSTCRRRKKGCDLARPICGQCLRSGNDCGGYQRDLTFIHHKVPEEERQSPSLAKQASRPDESLPARCETSIGDLSISSSPLSFEASTEDLNDQCLRQSSALLKQTRSHSPSLQFLPSTLSLTALTTLHVSVFNSYFLPRNSLAIKNLPDPFARPSHWTQFVPTMVHNDRALQLAYLALSSARIGHDNHDDNLLSSSKKLYGKALRDVQRALSDPKRRHTEETLLACSTLGIYEIFEAQTSAEVQQASAPNGWLSHSGAVARLLEARGPEAYTTDRGHQIFLHARIMITIRASAARKSCFLSQPRWLITPWRNRTKNLLHKLLDVMVFIPQTLETYDKLESDACLGLLERRHQREVLLADCVLLNQRLHEWFSQVCSDANGQPLWHTSLATDPSYPFAELISFDDHLMGYAIMLYWTCSLLTQANIRQLRDILKIDVSAMDDEDDVVDAIDPAPYAFNIAQALSSFVHPDMGALGPNLILFPVGMALGFFATPLQPSQLADWMTRKGGGPMAGSAMEQMDPDGKRPPTNIVLWLLTIFKDLNSRSMPGGVFLSGLIRAVGKPTMLLGVGSVTEA